ncbi:hypothetical protein QAD02_019110 [Eretmocerus hayati]|uniref:Uncharacterized protein n=1 Tax=Eretmocerus hayati TaxID=131215 RepID=A0ACC2PIN2_9HYME|nr:hypothetical protein QAD02_019110 [Eretmocerus hayati]
MIYIITTIAFCFVGYTSPGTSHRTVLQRDIESHGRIVSSVVKLGERVASLDACASGGDRQQQHEQALRIASSLERRWHLLFLRALEWQCHIEALAASVRTKVSFP